MRRTRRRAVRGSATPGRSASASSSSSFACSHCVYSATWMMPRRLAAPSSRAAWMRALDASEKAMDMAPPHLLAWKPVQAVRIAVTESRITATSSRQSCPECWPASRDGAVSFTGPPSGWPAARAGRTLVDSSGATIMANAASARHHQEGAVVEQGSRSGHECTHAAPCWRPHHRPHRHRRGPSRRGDPPAAGRPSVNLASGLAAAAYPSVGADLPAHRARGRGRRPLSGAGPPRRTRRRAGRRGARCC